MAALIDRSREPSAGELRWFGALFVAFSAVIGTVVYLRSDDAGAAVAIVAVAGALAAFYYAVPGVRRALLRGWVVLTYPLGWLGSHLVLAAFYFLIFTPVALVMRLLRRDALQRRLERDRSTYWLERPTAPRANRYWHQY